MAAQCHRVTFFVVLGNDINILNPYIFSTVLTEHRSEEILLVSLYITHPTTVYEMQIYCRRLRKVETFFEMKQKGWIIIINTWL